MPHQLPPVDDDVFEALQRLAEPLVDDVNAVLRRVLRIGGVDQPTPTGEMVLTGARPSGISVPRTAASGRTTKPRSAKTSKTKQRQSRPRAAHGTLLPEHEYEAPLLRALVAHGGSAPASQVIEDMGAALADRFTEADRETLDSGLTRWKNRVQFVRLRLVQAGQVKKDSPRGIWEVTSAGRERVDGFGSNE